MLPGMAGLRRPGSSHPTSASSKQRQIIVPQWFSGPACSLARARELVLCKPELLCYTLPAREPLFACSSVAQR